MKRILLFLSSFVIVIGAAAMVWLYAFATPAQRATVRAAKGDVQAQLWLARAYETGEGATQNRDRAVRYYTKAAHNGSDAAALDLGRLLLKEDNPKSAIGYFRSAAENGNVKAMINLARCAFLGLGMEKNETEGAAWVKKAAENGAKNSKALMGILYLGGIGVAQDLATAEMWLKKSGAPEAQELAARIAAERTIIDTLPPESRAEKLQEIYTGMEEGIRQTFTRLLESAGTAE